MSIIRSLIPVNDALRRRALRGASVAAVGAVVATAVLVPAGPAAAGSGGRFTILSSTGSYWGVDFGGATTAETPLVIDTDGNRAQELAVYNNGRFTVRADNGSYWGVTFPGAGRAETPLAIDTNGDGRQEFAVYNNGRFTWLNSDGSTSGLTFAGAGTLDIPVAADTDGDRVQEFGVYRAGRFTFRKANGTYWGVDFAGAGANELPFVIDTNADRKQELAVYRDGRVTIRDDGGAYWGLNFTGAGIDDFPIAVDTDTDGRQELAVYNHVPTQIFAKQILANGAVTYSASAGEDLRRASVGGPGTANAYMSSVIARVIVRASYGHSLRISALQDYGTGHTTNSLHYSGNAVDFSRFDGADVNGNDAKSYELINQVKYELPDGSQVGQKGCGAGMPGLPQGVTYIVDDCTHVHVAVPRSTPR